MLSVMKQYIINHGLVIKFWSLFIIGLCVMFLLAYFQAEQRNKQIKLIKQEIIRIDTITDTIEVKADTITVYMNNIIYKTDTLVKYVESLKDSIGGVKLGISCTIVKYGFNEDIEL